MATRRILGLTSRLSIVILLSIVAAAGCGGSGSSGTSGSGDTAVIAVAQAPAFPAGTLATAAPSAVETEAVGGATPYATNVDHVWITVEKVALIPGHSPGPDLNGEEPVQDGPGDAAGHVSAAVVPPTTIDLLNLPSADVAMFLNEIENIPAGTYGKIRLYYSDPKVDFTGPGDNVAMHPTANSHLDIHFVGGGMVIPVRTNPEGGVAVHNVVITFVLGKDGLKITENNNRILMRPQVFATVDTVQMAISGVADNVAAGSFDILTGPADGRSFHAVYGSIGSVNWLFKAPERENPVGVSPSLGVAALRDTAIVKVIGTFDSALVLHADEIWITFPVNQPGTVAAGWTDNSFLLNVGADNVAVRAQPDRLNAYYDNNVSPFGQLSDNAVVLGAAVTARGYATPGGDLEAYWISIGAAAP